jgi:DNA-binding transcriptional MocR family regulator
LVCKTLVDPGDVVVTEAPTYPGAVPTFCAYQADVVQVTLDRDGMRVDELEETLDELDRSGRRPKFIYTVPNFHNPAGVTMSLDRREQLVRIAGERELLVLEDNPYGLLRYEGSPLPTLHSLDDEFIIYASTFSKILSPGVRLGWACAPAPVLAKMNIGKQASDLCSSSISQHFVGAYFDSGPWLDYVHSLIEIYRRRRDVMLDSLAEHPSGGRPVHLGDAAGLHRHDRLAGAGARGARCVCARASGVRRRARRLVDAPELLGRRRGRDPRGRAANRRDRARAGRAVRHADRRLPGATPRARSAASRAARRRTAG